MSIELDTNIAKILQDEKIRSESIRKRLSECPAGKLHAQQKDGVPYFYLQFPGNVPKRKGLNRSPEILKGAILRSLLESELSCIESDIAILKEASRKLSHYDLTAEYISLKHRVPGLTDEMIDSALGTSVQSDWAKQEYRQSNYKPEEKKHITTSGLRVRSKSELAIAERLSARYLEYRYEQVIYTERSILIPDFTIRRRDGKIMYWEHEGLMNNAAYAERQYNKHRLYASINIVPWDNLIITYDDANGNIDMRIIESEIINKLIV